MPDKDFIKDLKTHRIALVNLDDCLELCRSRFLDDIQESYKEDPSRRISGLADLTLKDLDNAHESIQSAINVLGTIIFKARQ